MNFQLLVFLGHPNIQPWTVLKWMSPFVSQIMKNFENHCPKIFQFTRLCLSIGRHAIHTADCHYDLSFFPFFKVADIQNHIMPCYDPWHNETRKIEIEIFYKNLRLSSIDWFCFQQFYHSAIRMEKFIAILKVIFYKSKLTMP